MTAIISGARTRATAVIGASYGDEGKGATVDRLVAAAGGDALVVRFNSSAQAGHTVVAPDGRRHVFHHVGAGAFAGAATHFGPRFVAHPMLLGSELDALAALGVRPRLFADPRAPVAVPYDLLINQRAEQARGAARHGSCGIGFNEAVERSLRPAFAVRVGELADRARLAARLRAIRDLWVPRRLAVLGLAAPDGAEAALWQGDALIERWLEDAAAFAEQVATVPPGRLPDAGPVVFEGAQGLLLDEAGEDFPHVTRSRTGLCNVVRLAQETGIDRLDVLYVTRIYLTRHGAGPLPHERPGPPFAGVVDETNRPNPHQGTLRFAPLDLDALSRRIARDLAFRADGIRAEAALAVTCLDQAAGAAIPAVAGGRPLALGEEAFLDRVAAATGLPVRLAARGPARGDAGPLPRARAA